MNSNPPDFNARLGRDSADPAAVKRASVAIGFGSPSTDSGVTRLDLNDILVRHAEATFLLRAAGSAMRDMGIDAGDLLIVDKAIVPAHGHVVVAVVEDDLVCRKLVRQGEVLHLRAADPAVPDIVAGEGQGLQVWGVVTQVVKAMPV